MFNKKEKFGIFTNPGTAQEVLDATFTDFQDAVLAIADYDCEVDIMKLNPATETWTTDF